MRINERVNWVFGRWRHEWEQRYGRKSPAKIDGQTRSALAEQVQRFTNEELSAGLKAYLKDDWPERLAHDLKHFSKHVDKYVQQSKRGGSDGKTDKNGIIKAGDEAHEAECEKWRERWHTFAPTRRSV